MKRRRRREILIETEQIAFYRDKSKEGFLKCNICEDESIMLPPALIAEVLKISSREIYRLIEESKIHFSENDKNQMFICLQSLSKVFSEEKKLIH